MVYGFDRFLLDSERRILLKDGSGVALGAKAFDILLLLVRERGRPVSKDELMRTVWADTVVEENNLTVNISALRKALGEVAGSHRFIVTLPGRGYQWVSPLQDVSDKPVATFKRRASPRNLSIAGAALTLGIALAAGIYLRPEIGHEAQPAARPNAVHSEAHDLYIKGRYFWNKRSEEGITKAIVYFRQAVQKDPDFALAYAGLADCHFLQASGPLAPREAMSEARKAAHRALELDDTLAEAHTSMANIKRLDDFDWNGAEREFKRALALDPAYAPAHQGYAILLSALGRHDQAIAAMRKARQLQPASPGMIKNVARMLYEARRYDEAIAAYREALEMDPDFSQARRELGLAYEQKGMLDAAETELKRTIEMPSTYFKATAMADLAHVHASRGDTKAARQILADLDGMSAHAYVAPYDLAVVYAGLGERERALELLRRAYADRSRWMVWLGVDPRLDPLRSDAAFIALERRIGLSALR